MKTEEFTDKDAFLAAVTGKNRRASKRAREARPDVPRAARAAKGEGDRLSALARLADAGWVTYTCQAGQHWLSHSDGRTSPLCSSYGAAIDAALEEIT